MKDPTAEILTAFKTALSSIAYKGNTWHVYTTRPPKGKRNYIYLSEVTMIDASDQGDHKIFNCNLIIEISTKKNKTSRTIANALSNSILQVVEGTTLSMTNFEMIIKGVTQDVSMGKENEGSSNYTKLIRLNFSTEQK